MATTKIFPITATVGSAIAYIAAAAKTDNGRLISTFMCSREPSKAAKEFAEVTATGTGRSTVIAQHFIMSFKPGEVTPERAMEIGKEMCENTLKISTNTISQSIPIKVMFICIVSSIIRTSSMGLLLRHWRTADLQRKTGHTTSSVPLQTRYAGGIISP